MKARSVAIQGAITLAGLGLAYGTWQREPPAGDQEVVVLDVSRRQLEKIRYEEPARFAELDRRQGSGEPEVWIKVVEKPAAPVAVSDGGVVTPPPAAPVAKGPDRELRGNESSEKVFEKFSPLRAARSLGTLPPEKLQELGLATSQRKLEVTAAGTRHTFKIGSPTSGLATAYLQNEADGKVYLLGNPVLGDLEAANARLIDRRFHTFKPNEFDGFAVKSSDKSKEFTFSAGDQGQNARAAAKDTPDQADDFAKNWHEKIWRLIPMEILGKGENPSGGEPKLAVRVDYASRGKPQGYIEIAQVGANDLYARTEHTAGWVKVHSSAQDILQESKKVVGAQ
ncbi:MAG: DUF4340 domain-containing protein [Myxococcaceae bacterium]